MMEITFQELWRISHIKRWHMVGTTRDQTLAEHSYNVMILTMELIKNMSGLIPSMALKKAMTHDWSEVKTGDISPMAKGMFNINDPDVGIDWPHYFYASNSLECTFQEEMMCDSIVKLADQVEALRFLLEYGVGEYATEVRARLAKVIREKLSTKILCEDDQHEHIYNTCRDLLNINGVIVL